MTPESLRKRTVSLGMLSKVSYIIFFISTVVTTIYALVMIWGERTGENAWKSLGTALIFLVGSLLMLAANNIMAKNKWG